MNRYIVSFGLVLGVTGCAIQIPGSGSSSCIGFGCGWGSSTEAAKPIDRLTIHFAAFTKFDRSIKAPVDNFFARYRANRNDPQLVQLITRFLSPARAILAAQFSFPVELDYAVAGDLAQIKVRSRDANWNEASRGTVEF